MTDADIEALAREIVDITAPRGTLVGNGREILTRLVRDRITELVRPLREDIADLERCLDTAWKLYDAGDNDGN